MHKIRAGAAGAGSELRLPNNLQVFKMLILSVALCMFNV
jgi:hypothetical protein